MPDSSVDFTLRDAHAVAEQGLRANFWITSSKRSYTTAGSDGMHPPAADSIFQGDALTDDKYRNRAVPDARRPISYQGR